MLLRHTILKSVVMAILLVSLMSSSGRAEQSITSPNFVVQFRGIDKEAAKKLSTQAEKAFRAITSYLSRSYSKPILIDISDDHIFPRYNQKKGRSKKMRQKKKDTNKKDPPYIEMKLFSQKVLKKLKPATTIFHCLFDITTAAATAITATAATSSSNNSSRSITSGSSISAMTTSLPNRSRKCHNNFCCFFPLSMYVEWNGNSL